MKRFLLAVIVLGLVALPPVAAQAGCNTGYPYYSYAPVYPATVYQQPVYQQPVYQAPVYQPPVVVVPAPAVVPAPVIVPGWYPHHHHHPGYYVAPHAGVYYHGPHVSVGLGF
jgi:hypothetical protein